MSRPPKATQRGATAPRLPPADPTRDPQAATQSYGLDRRAFLQLMGAGAGMATVGGGLAGCGPSSGAPGEELPAGLSVIRPDDLFVAEFAFINLERTGDKLVKIASGADGYLIVRLPPQHVLEQAAKDSEPGAAPPPPVTRRLAGRSRLVFRTPEDFSELEYSLAGLLGACASWPLSVSPNAQAPVFFLPGIEIVQYPWTSVGVAGVLRRSYLRDGVFRASAASDQGSNVLVPLARAQAASDFSLPGGAVVVAPVFEPGPLKPAEPTERETALEIPHRLILSPHGGTTWSHPVELKRTSLGKRGERAELWHTRLNDERERAGALLTPTELQDQHGRRTLRALWSRDPDFSPTLRTDGGTGVYRAIQETAPETPKGSSPYWPLHAEDRVQLVHLTSNFALPRHPAKHATAERLMLSSLGGWLDARGEWSTLGGRLTLEAWEHRATMGRDQYVKVVNAGYLYPFGHRAVLVTVTERKVLPGTARTAWLWQRQFVVIKEPVKSYPFPDDGATSALRAAQRKTPFRSIEFTTLISDNLKEAVSPDTPFWVVVKDVRGASTPFQFAALGIDHEGRAIRFATGALWVPAAEAGPTQWATVLGKAKSAFAAHAAEPGYRVSDLQGQRVAFAPSASRSRSDGTTLEAHSLTFDVSLEKGTPAPGFCPLVSEAEVRIEALRHLAGKTEPVKVVYHEGSYAKVGFDPTVNSGEVLFEFPPDKPLDLRFSNQSDRSGGFLAPNLALTGLSRKSGPVGGTLSQAAKSDFKPSDFFGTVFDKAKLFGTINLEDILAGGLDLAPKFLTQAFDVFQSFFDALQRLTSFGSAAAERPVFMDGSPEQGEDEGLFSSRLGAIRRYVEAILAALSDFLEQDLAGVDLVKLFEPIFTPFDRLLEELDAAVTIAERLSSLTGGMRDELRSTRDTLVTIREVEKELKDALQAANQGLDMAKNLEVSLEWKPKIKRDKYSIFVPSSEDALSLSVTVRAKSRTMKDKHGNSVTLPAGADVRCSLDAFDLNLIGYSLPIVSLRFDHIRFSAGSGSPPEIDVALREIAFEGVLGFVERLARLIALDGLQTDKGTSGKSGPSSNGPRRSGAYLNVSSEGLTTGFSVGVPNIAIGVFSLQNMAFSAELKVPFLGESLALRFAFCSRENPFLLTVSVFGGGGFFAITLTPKGIQMLEASFEFGAAVALNFGVASGSVSVMGGVYFKAISDGKDGMDAELSGYLRIRGEVSVLDLISASIELYMELHYEFSSGKVVGRASIEIEVSVAFFSVDVTISVERKFAGSNGDPTFADLMAGPYQLHGADHYPWHDYCEAFADFAQVAAP